MGLTTRLRQILCPYMIYQCDEWMEFSYKICATRVQGTAKRTLVLKWVYLWYRL